MLLIFWLHNANQVPPSSIFVIWMIGWSGGVAKGVGILISDRTWGESGFGVWGEVLLKRDWCWIEFAIPQKTTISHRISEWLMHTTIHTLQFVQSYASRVEREASAGVVDTPWEDATKHALAPADIEIPVPQNLPNAKPYIDEGFGKLGHCIQYFNDIKRSRL